MNFMDAMKTESNKTMTLTENGALAYETSGKELCDFLFVTTAMRGKSISSIKNEITKVYFEDPLVANKFFFWDRDCRFGNGERKIFRAYLLWLAENKPEIAKAVIPLVPEYGRWDDLWCLLDTKLKDDVLKLISAQLQKDLEGYNKNEPISLLMKWSCSENSSSQETKRIAKIIREGLGMTPRQYRKTLSKLRAYLDVVEVKASSNRWGEIKYETVPSQANIKYSNAFMHHDTERRKEYLNSLVKGETKINAGVLQPHEIVNKYYEWKNWSARIKEYDEALEQLWKALPDKTLGNTLVVADTSGSMQSQYSNNLSPMDVAAALSIYMSEKNSNIWKDQILTFSMSPRFISFNGCSSLHDKLKLYYSKSEIADTDIEKTMLLILETAVKNHCSQEDMPKQILILSDCQFNSMVYIHGEPKALFENIADEYAKYGYQLPKIIFWNLSGAVNKTIPMQRNELGVILMSGFSVQLLDMVMCGETDPYKAILETINSLRYQPIEDAVKELI